ncbi:hypothetical protein C8R48DRAFT_679665 [Suillus tomentosus]|nr:hypothetical protein C8R48DRAFT_679665 [Suillus tomentosus]
MDQQMSQLTKLRAALTTRIKEIMGKSSATGIFRGGKLQTHLLNKARLRIGHELDSCLATSDVNFHASESISEYEINRAALTVAHAMVNPYYVDWDVDRFAEMTKVSTPKSDGPLANTDQLPKYFSAAMIGKISVPATIVDRQATKGLRTLLLETIKSSTQQSWRSQGFVVPEGGGEFGAGRVTVSPAYFMQRHERLEDPMVTSASYKSVEVQEWLATLSATESFWNAITAVSAPDLFEAGLEIIANRTTLSHRDSGGAPSLFDLLISLGSGHEAKLTLADVGAELDYYPGTMVFISGKILQHSIGPWGPGERLVIAHFMRDKIHSRVGKKTRLKAATFSFQGRGRLSKGKDLDVAYVSHKQVIGKRRKPTWVESCADSLYDTAPTPSPSSSPRKRIREDTQGLQNSHEDFDRQTLGDFVSYTQNDFIQEYLPFRDLYLDILLDLEKPSDVSQCQSCQIGEGKFRCLTCSGDQTFCRSCIVNAHQFLPFHKVQEWTGKCFNDTSLEELGFIWHMGHGGQPCPFSDDVHAWENIPMDAEADFSPMETVHGPTIPTKLTIVHSTGVFLHNVIWCSCPGVDYHFLIDALECKTSASSFFEKIRRMTNNCFPDTVPNRYRELMRVSRLWRDLMSRKWFGFAHDDEQKPDKGDLAWFCPACPQPVINLPPDWQARYERQVIYPCWLVSQRYVVDGNFTAQHMVMRKPQLDISLSDGLGYMVKDQEYQTHLSSAVESKERSSCSNHRAVNAANISRSNLRATGVGATACARHGCFVPHSIVDFQKGERHMNIDYSICNALNYHSAGIDSSLIIYDVGCQWSINFLQRVAQSKGLSVPENMHIVPAVGKFHLSAHKLACFARYSLNFIQGAGHVDGEILETLWAPFNKISPTARSMSQAHRQEVLDDHMRDSNWKKIVGIIKTLLKKYKWALKGVDDTKSPFDELTLSLDPEKILMWKIDEKKAMEQRGEYLDIYQLQMNKAPTMAEIRLKLTESENTDTGKPGTVSWLITGINLEDLQDGLRADIRQLPTDATPRQKASIEEKRQRLTARIAKFHETADAMTAGMDLGTATVHSDDPRFCYAGHDENGWGEVSDEEISEYIDEEILAEEMGIWMPSSVPYQNALALGLGPLQAEELELRKGQANDCLEKLRMALGHKAIIYRQYFRSANSTWAGTRSKQEAQRYQLKIDKCVRSYQRARSAMEGLGMDKATFGSLYQPISPTELSIDKEVTEENRFGQGSDRLAWFWRGNHASQGQDDAWIDESPTDLVYRVNWLKAKARWNRWQEELRLVRHEMGWTINWFKYHQNEWERRGGQATRPGHQAYAYQQVLMWGRFVEGAEKNFNGCSLASTSSTLCSPQLAEIIVSKIWTGQMVPTAFHGILIPITG